MVWTKEEIYYLKANYEKNPNMDKMSKKLGKSKRAIQHKGSRIGLSRLHC